MTEPRTTHRIDSSQRNRKAKISSVPSMFSTLWVLIRSDANACSRSWLVRGFWLVTLLVSVLTLKSMQAEQAVASRMLEALYSSYVLIWMHGIIFIAGAALMREQDCVGDAILSRGITRSEYIGAKLVSRTLVTLFLLGSVILPASFWAIRQDQLVRTDTGHLSANAEGVVVEAWEPKKVFSGVNGQILQLELEVGDEVHTGEILMLIDDRELHDALEAERRNEQNARNEVDNSHRQYENAKRAVSQAEEALARAERALISKDLMSKLEQSDREADLRTRKRELKDAENAMHQNRSAIDTAERKVEEAQTKVLAARKRLSEATIISPLQGYLTELHVQSSQWVSAGGHLVTVAPLDDYQLRVPIYNFNEFKRLKAGLEAFISIQGTEYKGTIDRLGAMTEKDRWGRMSNYAIVRFQGDGSLGILGLNADVRMVLPPPEKEVSQGQKILNALTGHGEDDLETRTASVTLPWMLLAAGRVLGAAVMLVCFSLCMVVLFRNALFAILGTTGAWHISNLVFDFAGLPELSYLEMVRTMDKVLGGIVDPVDELQLIAWLLGIASVFAFLSVTIFVRRDPAR